MSEKNYEEKMSGRDNYLILNPPKVPLYEMELLTRKQISGSLPLEIALQGGYAEFWFRLTGCVSVRNMMEMRKFGEEDLLSLMRSVCLFSKELERNLLNPLGVMIGLDSIFYKEDKYLFSYNPSLEAELKDGLLEMVEEMLTLIDYKNQNAVKLLYHMYDCLNQQNPDYEKLQYYIKEEFENETVIEKARSETGIMGTLGEEEKEKEKAKWPAFVKKVEQEKDRFCRNIKGSLLSLKKKAGKKLELYADLKPVIIREEKREETWR